MRAFLLPLLSAFTLTGHAMAQTPAFPDNAKLLEIIKARVDDGRATGLVLGVIEADGSTRIVSYGNAGEGAPPLGPDTVFEIGSITKVFTTTVLADMVLKNEVTLDAPAQVNAPSGMTLPKRGDNQITLANLAEQNSGLPRLPLNMAPADMNNPYADYTTDQLNAYLGSHKLRRDPGAEFEYSNLGMGVLGNVLACRAGQDYETLVKERILKPLGMDSSGITLTPAMQAALAKGHGADGSPARNWDLPSLAGAGALRSTATDMLKFLAANLGEPQNDLERAMRLAHQPRFTLSPNSEIGLGWITMTTKSGAHLVFHDGGTGGYGAIAGFDPARNVGLVLLGNRTGIPEDIAIHLMDPAFPLAPPPAAKPERAVVAVPEKDLNALTGVYALDAMPTFQLTVTITNGQLNVAATGQGAYPVFAESPLKFFYKVVDAQLTFIPAADGKPAAVILHQGGADQRATKVS